MWPRSDKRKLSTRDVLSPIKLFPVPCSCGKFLLGDEKEQFECVGSRKGSNMLLSFFFLLSSLSLLFALSLVGCCNRKRPKEEEEEEEGISITIIITIIIIISIPFIGQTANEVLPSFPRPRERENPSQARLSESTTTFPGRIEKERERDGGRAHKIGARA